MLFAIRSTTPDNTRHGDHVSERKRDEFKRNHSIEGGFRADVNEGRGASDKAGQGYGVHWYQEVGWTLDIQFKKSLEANDVIHRGGKPTFDVHPENGNPLSRTNANICLDVEALKPGLLASDKVIMIIPA